MQLPAHRTPQSYPRIRKWIEARATGADYKQAAVEAGIQTRTADKLMRDPRVRAAFEAECEVRRADEKARNISTAIAIRDASQETAAERKTSLEALKWLHGEPENSGARSINISVQQTLIGYQMDLSETASANRPAQVIDAIDQSDSD